MFYTFVEYYFEYSIFYAMVSQHTGSAVVCFLGVLLDVVAISFISPKYARPLKITRRMRTPYKTVRNKAI